MASFYLGKRQTTNLSTLYFTPYFTFSDQYVVPIRSYIWTKNNGFSFTGDYRFMKYPQPTYELGAPSAATEQALIDYFQLRFYQNAAVGVADHLAVGVGIQLDHYYNINQKEKYTEGAADWETYGDTGLVSGTSSGATLEIIYDSRGNTINSEKEIYGRVIYRSNQPGYGSTTRWNSCI